MMFQGCTIYTIYLMDHYSKCLVSCFFSQKLHILYLLALLCFNVNFSIFTQYSESKITVKTQRFHFLESST